MKFKIRIVFIFLNLLFLCGYNLYSQFDPNRLYIRNISLNQGLSQCVVTDLIEDNNGFLWIATFDGLNRFDGTHIKVFRHDPDNPQSIKSSRIFKIISDNNEHLYLNTADGICYFDIKTEKKFSPPFLKEITPLWFGKSNQDDYLWMYTADNKIYKMYPEDFTYKEFLQLPFSASEKIEIIKILESRERVFIVLKNSDILVFNQKTQKIDIYRNQSGNVYAWTSALFDKYGNILIASKEADLIQFDTQKMIFSKTDFYEKNKKLIAVERIIYDSVKDYLLLSSYGQGLFVYDYQKKTMEQFVAKNSSLPISSNYILGLRANRYGVIYIAYDGSGIDIIDPFIKKFITIKSKPNEENRLKYVRKMVEDDEGNIFIGTSETGLVQYNRNTKELYFFNSLFKEMEKKSFVLELLLDRNNLWIGYNSGGVDIMDVKTKKIKKSILVGNSKNELSNGTIWSFLKDEDGIIWIGTRDGGLNKLDDKTFFIKQYTEQTYPEFSNNGIRCLYNYKKQNLLLGTVNGIFIFDKENEKIHKVFPLSEKQNSFKSVKSIFIDYQNRYWVATDGGGIVILDTNFNLIKNFNTNNGLNNNVVYGILPESKNIFWISTNNGICKIQWNDKNIYENSPLITHNYDEMNGLQSNEFNTAAFLLLKDGEMAFGGLNGINIFNPKEILNNEIKPTVYFTEFKIFENAYTSDTSISFLNNIYLKHYENSISITFNSIGFSLTDKVNYKYRLLGYEKKWVYSSNRNYVSYTNLPSGEYKFEVLAMNYDGIWSDDPKTLIIHIATPYYNTWWFYSLIGLTISTLLYSIIQYRTKLNKEKEQIKLRFTKELAEVEMKALRAQINPHFLFNSLNSINSFILKNDTQNASKYLIKFSQLVRNILNNSSSTFVTIREELKTIELYLLIEGMRFDNKFSYKVEIDENINTELIYIPSLLLQPYVENAIWHGLLHKMGEKQIVITIKKVNEKSIAISIEDNGIGREASGQLKEKSLQHKSFGMKLGESRLRLLNLTNDKESKVEVVDLFDNNQKSLGTRIDILIPIKSNVVNLTD